jgi:hypothetical protein
VRPRNPADRLIVSGDAKGMGTTLPLLVAGGNISTTGGPEGESAVGSEPSTSSLPPGVPKNAWMATAGMAPFLDRTGRFALPKARKSTRGFRSAFTACVSTTPPPPGTAANPCTTVP